MSNYAKTTNFAVKDALVSGDPLKTIKGTDINTEFDNIATAVATKTDNAGAAITSGTINGTTIGNSTPSTGAFTTLSASSGLNSSAIGNTTPSTGAFTTISATTSAVWGTGVASFGMITRRKTADESVASSTVLQNDDHLTFAIAANEEWCGHIDLTFTGLTDAGWKDAITVPAGATLAANGMLVTGAGNPVPVHQTVSGSNIDSSGAVASGTCRVLIQFWVLNGSTAGSVTLQWAQFVSHVNAVTVYKGAMLQAVRVA